jgi:hypothetical protein
MNIVTQIEVWGGFHVQHFEDNYLQAFRIQAIKDGVWVSRYVSQEDALAIWRLQNGQSIMMDANISTPSAKGGQIRCVPKNNYDAGLKAWRSIVAKLLVHASEGGDEVYPSVDELRGRATKLCQSIDFWEKESQRHSYNSATNQIVEDIV